MKYEGLKACKLKSFRKKVEEFWKRLGWFSSHESMTCLLDNAISLEIVVLQRHIYWRS